MSDYLYRILSIPLAADILEWCSAHKVDWNIWNGADTFCHGEPCELGLIDWDVLPIKYHDRIRRERKENYVDSDL